MNPPIDYLTEDHARTARAKSKWALSLIIQGLTAPLSSGRYRVDWLRSNARLSAQRQMLGDSWLPGRHVRRQAELTRMASRLPRKGSASLYLGTRYDYDD